MNQGLGIISKEEGRKNQRNEMMFSGHNRTVIHMNPQQLWQHEAQARQITKVEERGKHEVQLLAEKLLATIAAKWRTTETC